MSETPSPRVRVDRWLWAARFFKTRSEAAAAVAGGRIRVNGERPKPAKLIGVGDEIRVRRSGMEFHVMVRGVTEHRGPAPVARHLYEETPASEAARAALTLQRRAHPTPVYDGKGRPTKRDRRLLERWRDPGSDQ